MDTDFVTIEFLAQQAKCTWRTAKKRLVAHGIRPVSSTKKSELYAFAPAMAAITFGDDAQVLSEHARFQEGVCTYVMPCLFNADSPMLQCLVGLLVERGATKACALADAGAILIMALETLKTGLFFDNPKIEVDWISDAATRFPGEKGVELFEKYLSQ